MMTSKPAAGVAARQTLEIAFAQGAAARLGRRAIDVKSMFAPIMT